MATVAIARKLAVLCWQLLTREEDYAFVRPTLYRRKLRKLELRAGAPGHRGKHNEPAVWETRTADERERDLVELAEESYRQAVANRRSSQSAGSQSTGAHD